MPAPDLSHIAWRKSRHSAACSANCVEVGNDAGFVVVRDSLDPAGPVLAFSPTAWASFIDRVRFRGFDIRRPH